ncbi:hypothetical protein [Peribacillus kribbensis]|uniref:hypothetical protein n=1 Tax=Peribacillus kribbensis TaxID=356658 RepID=UPI0003F91471|nr:hypothetical protein [Peribacillus kribbensis]
MVVQTSARDLAADKPKFIVMCIKRFIIAVIYFDIICTLYQFKKMDRLRILKRKHKPYRMADLLKWQLRELRLNRKR